MRRRKPPRNARWSEERDAYLLAEYPINTPMPRYYGANATGRNWRKSAVASTLPVGGYREHS